MAVVVMVSFCPLGRLSRREVVTIHWLRSAPLRAPVKRTLGGGIGPSVELSRMPPPVRIWPAGHPAATSTGGGGVWPPGFSGTRCVAEPLAPAASEPPAQTASAVI